MVFKTSRCFKISPQDGANVDGSCILALPTDEPFEGGALHVWDGKPKQVTWMFLGKWVLWMVRCWWCVISYGKSLRCACIDWSWDLPCKCWKCHRFRLYVYTCIYTCILIVSHDLLDKNMIHIYIYRFFWLLCIPSGGGYVQRICNLYISHKCSMLLQCTYIQYI